MANTQFNTQKNTAAGTSSLPRTKYPGSPLLDKSGVTPIARTAAGVTLPQAFEDYRTKIKASDILRKMNENAASRDIASQMENVLALPRTAENVSTVQKLYGDREKKIEANPALAQYANDDIMQRAQVYTATPGAKDNVDYTTAIRQLSMLPVTSQTQAQMRDLLSARASKIAADPSLAQYADDEVMQLAKRYIAQYAPEKTDSDEYFKTADEVANRNYDETIDSLAKQEEAQKQNLRATFEQARRENDLAYALKSRQQENLLAQQGLGKGLGAAPSSGYSESARLGALADYANNNNQTYVQQEDAEREIAAAFEAQRMQAMRDRNTALLQNLYNKLQQENAERQFDLSVHNYNTGISQHDEAMDYQKNRDAVGDAYRDEEFERVKERDRIGDEWNNKLLERDEFWKDKNFENENYWRGKNQELAERELALKEGDGYAYGGGVIDTILAAL